MKICSTLLPSLFLIASAVKVNAQYSTIASSSSESALFNMAAAKNGGSVVSSASNLHELDLETPNNQLSFKADADLTPSIKSILTVFTTVTDTITTGGNGGGFGFFGGGTTKSVTTTVTLTPSPSLSPKPTTQIITVTESAKTITVNGAGNTIAPAAITVTVTAPASTVTITTKGEAITTTLPAVVVTETVAVTTVIRTKDIFGNVSPEAEVTPPVVNSKPTSEVKPINTSNLASDKPLLDNSGGLFGGRIVTITVTQSQIKTQTDCTRTVSVTGSLPLISSPSFTITAPLFPNPSPAISFPPLPTFPPISFPTGIVNTKNPPSLTELPFGNLPFLGKPTNSMSPTLGGGVTIPGLTIPGLMLPGSINPKEILLAVENFINIAELLRPNDVIIKFIRKLVQEAKKLDLNNIGKEGQSVKFPPMLEELLKGINQPATKNPSSPANPFAALISNSKDGLLPPLGLSNNGGSDLQQLLNMLTSSTSVVGDDIGIDLQQLLKLSSLGLMGSPPESNNNEGIDLQQILNQIVPGDKKDD